MTFIWVSNAHRQTQSRGALVLVPIPCLYTGKLGGKQGIGQFQGG